MTSINIVVIVIVVVIIIIAGVVISKSGYEDTMQPEDNSMFNYGDVMSKVAQLRSMAYEYEEASNSAAMRKSVAEETMKHEAVIKSIATEEARTLTATADAYEKLAEKYKPHRDNGYKKRTLLVPNAMTNCVGDRGNSIFPIVSN